MTNLTESVNDKLIERNGHLRVQNAKLLKALRTALPLLERMQAHTPANLGDLPVTYLVRTTIAEAEKREPVDHLLASRTIRAHRTQIETARNSYSRQIAWSFYDAADKEKRPRPQIHEAYNKAYTRTYNLAAWEFLSYLGMQVQACYFKNIGGVAAFWLYTPSITNRIIYATIDEANRYALRNSGWKFSSGRNRLESEKGRGRERL